MIKAFLSHSSKQKEFTRELANELGLDSCIFDERTFESGMPIMSEIISSLNDTDIFILLISDAALESEWVQKEVMLARDLIEEGLINRFIPYIIDDKITHEDSRIKPWIRKSYLLSTIFTNPLLLARRIKENIREISWTNFPLIKGKQLLFIGRNNEISEIETKYYDGNFKDKKVVIASGFTGIGRKKLLMQFINTKLDKKNSYEPIVIELSSHANIEDFILQLNHYILFYKKNEILDKLKEGKYEKVLLAVELINHVSKLQEKIIIRDYGSCILSNGYLSTWFLDLIKNNNLVNQLSLFVTSNARPVSSLDQNFKEIISIQVLPFNKVDRKKLFYAYAELVGISLKDEDANFFLNMFSGKPEQIFKTIDSIKESNSDATKKKIEEILKIGDGDVVSILNLYKSIPNALQLLILISKFEFISYDIIKRLTRTKDNIDSLLENFNIYSITENIGSYNNYIRINSTLRDYIDRSKLKLEPELNQELSSLTRDFLSQNSEYELKDLSDFLYNVKELIKSDPKKVPNKYLIPSFFLKTIVDQYKDGNYKEAIELSEKILFDSNKFYDEINRELRYWMCLALCRVSKKDASASNKFFNSINEFDEKSKNFLLGFYFRFNNDFSKAENYYSKVLEIDNMKKARREMVIVKTALKKYHEALSLAKKNYEENTVNAYNIEAYFRCLIRKNSPNYSERQILKKLINEMESSFDIKKNVISKTLKAEYKFFIEQNISGAISDLQDIIKSAGKLRYYPLRSLNEIYHKQDSKQLSENLRKEYNTDFDYQEDD